MAQAIPKDSPQHKEQGQSLTELALMLPVLLMMLVGALDLGRAFYAYVAITNASREGARAGMNGPGRTAAQVTSIKNRVLGETGNVGLNLTASNIAVECAPSSGGFSSAYCASSVEGDQLRVTVSFPFPLITTYILGLSNVNLSNFTTMLIAR